MNATKPIERTPLPTAEDRSSPTAGRDLAEVLGQAANCINAPSETQGRVLERLNALRHRLSTERFQFAALGQFKRGKSTVLNALLGRAVLPVGVVPVTAIDVS